MLAVLCLAAVLLEAAAEVLPDAPLVSVLTPLRLVLAVGLVALVAGGARLAAFRTRLDLPIVLLVLAATVTTAAGGWSGAPLRGLLTVLAGYYLVVGLRRIWPASTAAIGLLALVAVAVPAALALGQATDGTPTGFCRTGLLAEVPCGPGALVRAVGTFPNPNLLAAFLVLFAPLTMLAGAALADLSARVVMVGVMALGYAALLVTFSRAGYLAAAAGVLALALAHRRVPRAVALVGAAALAAAGVLIAAVSGAASSLGVRGQVWAAALDIAAEHPLGIGLGRAGPAIDARVPGAEQYQHAHNLWLNWLVEAGLLGLVAVIAVTALGVATAAGAARRGSPVGATGLAGLIGFLLMSVLDHPANASRIAAALWVVLGVVMAEAPARWRPGRRTQARHLAPASGRLRRHNGCTTPTNVVSATISVIAARSSEKCPPGDERFGGPVVTQLVDEPRHVLPPSAGFCRFEVGGARSSEGAV